MCGWRIISVPEPPKQPKQLPSSKNEGPRATIPGTFWRSSAAQWLCGWRRCPRAASGISVSKQALNQRPPAKSMHARPSVRYGQSRRQSVASSNHGRGVLTKTPLPVIQLRGQVNPLHESSKHPNCNSHTPATHKLNVEPK